MRKQRKAKTEPQKKICKKELEEREIAETEPAKTEQQDFLKLFTNKDFNGKSD